MGVLWGGHGDRINLDEQQPCDFFLSASFPAEVSPGDGWCSFCLSQEYYKMTLITPHQPLHPPPHPLFEKCDTRRLENCCCLDMRFRRFLVTWINQNGRQQHGDMRKVTGLWRGDRLFHFDSDNLFISEQPRVTLLHNNKTKRSPNYSKRACPPRKAKLHVKTKALIMSLLSSFVRRL